MSCERCDLIEVEYASAEAEDMTRDALLLALAAVRVERNRLRLHCQSYQADLDEARAMAVRLRLRCQRMEVCIATFSAVVEQAEAAAASKGGQHVPYHGDFAAVPPSVRGRLRWWARHLSDATKEEP